MSTTLIGRFYGGDNGEECIELLWDSEEQYGFYWSVHRQQRLPFPHSVVQAYDEYGDARTATYTEVLAEWEAKQRGLEEEAFFKWKMLGEE